MVCMQAKSAVDVQFDFDTSMGPTFLGLKWVAMADREVMLRALAKFVYRFG